MRAGHRASQPRGWRTELMLAGTTELEIGWRGHGLSYASAFPSFHPRMSETPDASTSRIDAVALVLGYRFKNSSLLTQACTHTSRLGAQATPADKRRDANERLEFLGDALLGAALCQVLCERFPNADEGPLSRLKSRLVSRATLARALEITVLPDHCLVGQQMSKPWPDSVKANFAEAILAAIFVDGGWTAVHTAVERLLNDFIEDPMLVDEDARMALQVWCLEHHKQLPSYTSDRAGGTDHEPMFRAQVSIAGTTASGEGTSRRRAEAAAAQALMVIMNAK
jgi:ribonuclease III